MRRNNLCKSYREWIAALHISNVSLMMYTISGKLAVAYICGRQSCLAAHKCNRMLHLQRSQSGPRACIYLSLPLARLKEGAMAPFLDIACILDAFPAWPEGLLRKRLHYLRFEGLCSSDDRQACLAGPIAHVFRGSMPVHGRCLIPGYLLLHTLCRLLPTLSRLCARRSDGSGVLWSWGCD